MALTAESNRQGPGRPQASLDGFPRRCGLSSDDERELIAPVDGDCEARDSMVRANLGLVVAIARDFRHRGLELDDLIGEGNLGLIRAAQKFDPSFGVRFSTYAAFWIKEAIHCALINTTATIRVPGYMTRLLTKWRRTERILFQKAGRAPTFEEIASSLQFTDVQKSLVARAFRVGNLQLEANYSAQTGNTLADEARDRQPPIEYLLESAEEWVITVRRMGRLESRERTILALHFGLGGEALTLREIGRRLGITTTWARTIKLRALHKLSFEAPNDVKPQHGVAACRQRDWTPVVSV
jgi:RNA polymerase primary sigma factor